MTDERFEQLMKQALKPEIDERDVVIQKSTNNYKNRMKRKRRLRVCITAGIAAAACVVAGVQLNRFGNGQVPYTETKQDFVTNKTSSAFSLCVYASELSSENSVALNNENGNSWVFGMRSDSDMLSYCIAFPVSCKGEQIKQITYTINKGAFQIIGENPEKFCTQMTLYTEQTICQEFPKTRISRKVFCIALPIPLIMKIRMRGVLLIFVDSRRMMSKQKTYFLRVNQLRQENGQRS